MPPPLSVSTVVASTPPSMAHVPSAAKSSPLSVLPGTKIFPTPPMWASLKPPLRVQLLLQSCLLPQPDTALVSLPPANLPIPRPLDSFGVPPTNLALPLPSPAGISLVLAAPSFELAPVPTGASPPRPTSTWILRCRQALPHHRVLHHPHPSIALVVEIFPLFSIIVSLAVMFFKLFLVFLLR